jgi:hypothetical protein
MWAVRELLRLVEKIGVGVGVALVLALVQAPLRGHGHFWHGFHISCLIVGALLLLMAGVGNDSNWARGMDFSVTQAAWGRIPGMSTLERTGEDPRLTPGAVFAGAGIAVLAIGFFA